MVGELDEFYSMRHKVMELPCARVRTPSAGGSGTVLYSASNGNGGYSTYILTNNHVIESAVKIVEEWSTLLQARRKRDASDPVDVHLFNYRWEQRAVGGLTVQADIVAYDKNEDLALLHLRDESPAPAVAKLYPRGEESWLRPGMPVVAVGAGLGEPPVQTTGFLSQFGRDIEQREYWLSTAPTIFGNSGGALFLGDLTGRFLNDNLAMERSFTMIGVPALIAVTMSGFSASAITHLSFAIPITRIYTFLEQQRFRFIYDSTYTEAGEVEERKRLREEQERKLAAG